MDSPPTFVLDPPGVNAVDFLNADSSPVSLPTYGFRDEILKHYTTFQRIWESRAGANQIGKFWQKLIMLYAAYLRLSSKHRYSADKLLLESRLMELARMISNARKCSSLRKWVDPLLELPDVWAATTSTRKSMQKNQSSNAVLDFAIHVVRILNSLCDDCVFFGRIGFLFSRRTTVLMDRFGSRCWLFCICTTLYYYYKRKPAESSSDMDDEEQSLRDRQLGILKNCMDLICALRCSFPSTVGSRVPAPLSDFCGLGSVCIVLYFLSRGS